jgi:hypothetical protein
MSKKDASERLTILTSFVRKNIHEDGDPRDLLEMVDECIPLAMELDLDPEVLESMYATRAHALQKLALKDKLEDLIESKKVHQEEINQHNYQVIGEAMREYLLEKEPQA